MPKLTMPIFVAAVAVVCLSTACDMGGEPDGDPVDGDCAALHEHLLDLRLRASRPSATDFASEKLAGGRHRENLRKSSRRAFLKRCREGRSSAYVSCGLAAENIDALSECRDL